MTAAERSQILALMAQGKPDFKDDTATVREAFDGLLATLPVDEEVLFETRTIAGIPGVWADGPQDNGRVLLYLHGGAYVVGTPHGYRSLSSNLAQQAGTALFSPRYRLAPEHQFPAPVDDALAAYRGLLEEGYEPSSIVVAGDSAGGGLAAALLLAIREAGLTQPAAAWLLSPWADLSCSAETMRTKAHQDPLLDAEGLRRKAAEYLGEAPADSPLASPAVAELHDLAPLLVHVGSHEILLDDAVSLVGRAGAAGTSARLVIGPEMFHVWPLFGFMLTEGREALAEAGRFLAEHLQVARHEAPTQPETTTALA
ncbi:alpha/beta hydrolase fold domain-containing protein [Kocuria arenosa]|uniref:alpha/beta hydrolase fold domain-containing protein n=1 Tax=Kocuria arenosa TaxID=3071446 RepID=UPI0034D3D273